MDLRYISDAFEEKFAVLDVERDQGADPQDSDEYAIDNIFWAPTEVKRDDLPCPQIDAAA